MAQITLTDILLEIVTTTGTMSRLAVILPNGKIVPGILPILAISTLPPKPIPMKKPTMLPIRTLRTFFFSAGLIPSKYLPGQNQFSTLDSDFSDENDSVGLIGVFSRRT